MDSENMWLKVKPGTKYIDILNMMVEKDLPFSISEDSNPEVVNLFLNLAKPTCVQLSIGCAETLGSLLIQVVHKKRNRDGLQET